MNKIGILTGVVIALLAAGVLAVSLYPELRNEKKLRAMGENRVVFEAFFSELESETGCKVLITSGYRDAEKQKKLHKQNPKNAPAGKSRHEKKKAMDINLEELDSLLRQALTTSSLDAPVNGEEGRSFLGDLIADASLEEPLDLVEQRIHHEQLGRWLSHLSEQEQHVLKMRFGLEGQERHTLAEIGRLMEVSRERVRQVELKALRKLRNLTRRLPSGI